MLAASILGAAIPALAQKSVNMEQLLIQRKFVEAEEYLNYELNKRPGSDSAHYFLGQLIVRSRTAERYDEAIDHFKKCVALKPGSATYHHWLGRAYGVKAQNAGGLGATAYLGDIREEFLRAIELDSFYVEARYDLIQFYLRTPGILGGSDAKAKSVAEECYALSPSVAPLLGAAIDVHMGEFDKAYAKTMAVRPPSDYVLLGYYRNTAAATGFSFLDNKQPVMAAGIFRKFTEEFPFLAIGFHGLGCAYLDAGKIDDAIAAFEQAIILNNQIGSQYRLGLAWEKKGDREKAIRFLGEFLRLKYRIDNNFAKDAAERLERLKNEVSK